MIENFILININFSFSCYFLKRKIIKILMFNCEIIYILKLEKFKKVKLFTNCSVTAA